MLNQTLLNACEEFFDEIENHDNDTDLDSSICHLRRFLEQDVDGYSAYADCDLAESTLDQLDDIWSMISRKEKNQNPELELYYSEARLIAKDALNEADEELLSEQESYLEDLVDDCDDDADDEEY